jgi:hypothetical protein
MQGVPPVWVPSAFGLMGLPARSQVNWTRLYFLDNYRFLPWGESNLHWGSPTARSNYNALETRIMRQATRDLRMILSYTWGKSIDDSSGYFAAENGIGGSSAVQNYFDPRSNRSVSSYDIPHLLSAAALYEFPVGHGKKYLNHGAAAYVR